MKPTIIKSHHSTAEQFAFEINQLMTKYYQENFGDCKEEEEEEEEKVVV